MNRHLDNVADFLQRLKFNISSALTCKCLSEMSRELNKT